MSNKSVFTNPTLKAQKSSRNAFDLGHKRAFHASLGEILPIFHADVPAGSYIEITEQNQTYNMNPVIRPAFARIKEHIDYFAVPKVQLWSLYDNFITGQSQYMSSALGQSFLSGHGDLEEIPNQLPMMEPGFLKAVFANMYETSNPFGVNELNGTLKLLDLLGYGNYYPALSTVGDKNEVISNFASHYETGGLKQNFMNILAYQKIYYSYYRNSKYEKNIPAAYNMDWLPKTKLNLAYADYNTYIDNFHDMFRLHFRWLKKDYFMSSQPSVLPTSSDVGFDGLSDLLMEGQSTTNAANKFWQLFSLPGMGANNQISQIKQSVTNSNVQSNIFGEDVTAAIYASSSSPANANMNVSALRFAFAFDKLLRRMRTAGATFDDQMLAQYGIKPVDYRHGDAFYLGGYTNRLNLSEVTQTSEYPTNGVGQFGANISKYSANSKKISYHAKEDVIIMGIYSTSYDVDYPSTRFERDNLRRFRFDHYNPAFENLGLQALYQGELNYIADQTTESNMKDHNIATTCTDLLSFNKRYLEYKTKLDVVNGLFDYGCDNASVMPWSTQYRFQTLNSSGNVITRNNGPLAQHMMLVSPLAMNDIVTVNYSGAWENDHFLCNLYNDVKLVANMSIDGEVF